jgi:protein ImuA
MTKHSEVIAQLRTRLREMERSHRKNVKPPCSSGTPLDQLLPVGGIEWGTLMEWLAQGEGTGMATLALIVSSHLLLQQGIIVVLDSRREFYPAAAAGLGISLERMVIVRPPNRRDELWAWEQSLRSPAATVVLGWTESLKEGEFRRLQLAAEAGGGVGFLLRSHFFRHEPSWAETRFLVEARPTSLCSGARQASQKRRMRVEVLRTRGGAGGVLELELSHEEVHVRVVSSLADPAPAPRSAGA